MSEPQEDPVGAPAREQPDARDAILDTVMDRDRRLAEQYAYIALGPWSSKQEGALSDLANGVLLAQRELAVARAANAALTKELAGLREQLDAARDDSVRKNLATLNEAFAHVPEAVKVLKVGEEFGEASEAYIGLQGLNPRKGVTHNADDVAKELADVAITALVAMEHFSASPVQTLTNRLSFVAERARAALGVVAPPPQEGEKSLGSALGQSASETRGETEA